MSKVYSSAVVIIPPKEIWESIQEIRKVYDRNINRWMPHITAEERFSESQDDFYDASLTHLTSLEHIEPPKRKK